MTNLWRPDAFFDVMTNLLTYFWCHDKFFDNILNIRTYFGRDILFLTSWLTFSDVMTNFLTSWHLFELRSICKTIVLRLCVSVCLSVRDDIAIQLYMRVDTPLRVRSYWNLTLSEHRTTAFVMTLSFSLKSSKCNIIITNWLIALKCDTGLKHQKVHTQNNYQWLDLWITWHIWSN